MVKSRRISYQSISKILYDQDYTKSKCNVGNSVIYEEFKYRNTRIMLPFSNDPNYIICKLSNFNYEPRQDNYDRPSYYCTTELIRLSK